MHKKIIQLLHFLIIKKTDSGLLQFLRYLIAGGSASIVDASILFVLNHFLGVSYLWFTVTLGFLSGMTTNYTINTLIVFESGGKKKTEFSIFALIGLGGLAWTQLIFWVLVKNLGVHVMLTKLIAIILVLNWNFFMRKKFVFKKTSLIS
jgi:putative flippase GtrA